MKVHHVYKLLDMKHRRPCILSPRSTKPQEKNIMEQFYLFLMLLFLSTLSLFILFFRHACLMMSPNLPPGKIGYPVIGESFAFLSSGWKGKPESFILERMTQYSSRVFKTSLFGEPMVMFCGSACNKFLFSNEGKLVRTWWPESVNKIFPTSLQTSATEESKKMRHMLPQFLNAKALQRYVGIMDSVAQRHFASEWENNSHVTVFPLTKR